MRKIAQRELRNYRGEILREAEGGEQLLIMKEQEVALRVTVVDPPVDVLFALQRGRFELHQPTRSTGRPISFDFTVRIRPGKTADAFNLLGPFTQGPPASRFVYVSSGTYGGDTRSCWSRRAKVPLTGITPDLVKQLEQAPESLLEARIAGKAKDSGPACASVPLLGQGWAIVVLR